MRLRMVLRPSRLWCALLPGTLLLTGCLHKGRPQAAALQAATAPLLDSSTAAYRDANLLAERRQDAEAYAQFYEPDPVYNPRTITPVLTEHDIAVRVTVLRALEVYVEDVAALLDGNDSAALRAASASLGQAVVGAGNAVARAGGAAAPPLGTPVSNDVSAAAEALGRFLTARKIRRSLPGTVARMDPHVAALTTLLEGEASLLRGREQRDTDTLIDLQTLYLRQSWRDLGPKERRAGTAKLPALVRDGRTATARLDALATALHHVRETHHALAETLGRGDHATSRQRLLELVAAAQALSTPGDPATTSQSGDHP